MSEFGVLVLGDSHAKSFFPQGQGPQIDGQDMSVYGEAMQAASVTGFGRRRSALNVNAQARKMINEQRQNCQHLVFALGQVDVELGLYYRWVVKDKMIEPETLFHRITEKYINNVKAISGSLRPIIKGINQTVLKRQPHALGYTSRIILENESDPERVAALKVKLREVYPSYDVRRFINTMFNDILAAAAAKAGIRYFDINSAIVDKETGEVADVYCPNFNDHHVVNSVAMHNLHIKHLLAAIGRRPFDDQKTL